MITIAPATAPPDDMNSLTQTVIPALVDANYTNSVAFLQQYTNYLSIIQEFTDSVDRCIRYNKALNSSEVVNNSVSIFKEVNDNYKTLDNQFLIYWLGKYKRSVATIQQLVLSQAGPTSIYGQLSDSIGLLSNTSNMLTDSVIPYNDIDVTTYPAPITYPANLANKIRPNSLSVASSLSKATTIMFRQNIINIQFLYATSSEAHGSNLITDIASYSSARQYATTIVNQLKSDFSVMFKLMGFFCNINDYTGYNPADYTLNQASLAGNIYFTSVVQGSNVTIDLLGKRVKDTRSSLTIAGSLVSTT